MSLTSWDTDLSSSYLAALARNDDLRSRLASLLAETVESERSSQFPHMQLTGNGDENVSAQLRSDGTARLGDALSRDQVDEIIDHFSNRPLYSGHIASLSSQKPCSYEHISTACKQAAYSLSDIVEAPHLLEIANSNRVLSVVSNYLGCLPSIYSMNCWWSFSGDQAGAAVAQRYHRDPDDYRFCSLFIYLTDVGPENGPHIYLRRSHDLERFRETLRGRISDARRVEEIVESSLYRDGNSADLESVVNEYLRDMLVEYVGNAGSAFIEDTYGLHKGQSLVTGRRLVFWVRYGMRKTLSYVFDKTAPVEYDVRDRLGDNPLYQFVNRLILRA